jgi:hypothetical protein
VKKIYRKEEAKVAEKRGNFQLEVIVELSDVMDGEDWPKIAAYVFSRSGHFLIKEEIKRDPRKPTIGKANFKIKAKREHLIVKIGPLLEKLIHLEHYQPVTKKVLVKDKAELAFKLEKTSWICWLKLPYYITGSVKKQKTGLDAPICAGEVIIYDVDIKYCLLKLPDTIIERIREAIIDVVIDPPPIDLMRIEFNKPDVWWKWDDDDDRCGNVPKPPFPSPRMDIIRKLESLPQEWAFAKNRYEALETAKERMDETLCKMTINEKSTFLNNEIVSDINLSRIVYTNTAQFRHLLVAKFEILRFWLCWWPWIYWLWWPYCGYSLEEIGRATLQPDGSFSETVWLSVCRKDKPDLWFEVHQTINGIERVIYAKHPVPCNTYWNHPSGVPVHLLVTDPDAVACPQNIPGIADPYVMPMGIYEDEWYQIDQAHIKTAVDPTTVLPANCGLYKNTDPYGTRLDLRMQFHDDLRDILLPGNGARYYRWSYRKHGQTAWTHIATPIIHRYITTNSSGKNIILSEKLGPDTVGTKNNLFTVPDPDKSWLDNRNDLAYAIWYTATWDGSQYVSQIPNGKYDLRLEIFDKSGAKLTPTGAGFKFTLPKELLGPVDDTLFIEADGSLILHLHIDNNDTQADIKSVALNGVKAGECQFIEYSNKLTDTLEIECVAYHPTITPNFLKKYNLTIRRGISGTKVGAVNSTTPALPVPPSFLPTIHSFNVGTLLGMHEQCAFNIWLHTWQRARNGHSPIRAYEDSDASAFALVKKK